MGIRKKIYWFYRVFCIKCICTICFPFIGLPSIYIHPVSGYKVSMLVNSEIPCPGKAECITASASYYKESVSFYGKVCRVVRPFNTSSCGYGIYSTYAYTQSYLHRICTPTSGGCIRSTGAA